MLAEAPLILRIFGIYVVMVWFFVGECCAYLLKSRPDGGDKPLPIIIALILVAAGPFSLLLLLVAGVVDLIKFEK